MKKLNLVGAALIAFVALGATAGNPEASSAAQTTIDRGVLTTTSPDFILRIELRSGAAELTRLAEPGAGNRFSFAVKPDPGVLANLDFMVLGAAKSGRAGAAPVVATAMCQTQADNVNTAATLVSNTCTAGPPTNACNAAMEAFNEAVNSFRDCIRNFQAQK